MRVLIRRSSGNADYTNRQLEHLTLIGALRGQAKAAARVVGYVDAQFRALGYEREYAEKWGYEKLMAALHEQLSEGEIDKLAAEGAV